MSDDDDDRQSSTSKTKKRYAHEMRLKYVLTPDDADLNGSPNLGIQERLAPPTKSLTKKEEDQEIFRDLNRLGFTCNKIDYDPQDNINGTINVKKIKNFLKTHFPDKDTRNLLIHSYSQGLAGSWVDSINANLRLIFNFAVRKRGRQDPDGPIYKNAIYNTDENEVYFITETDNLIIGNVSIPGEIKFIYKLTDEGFELVNIQTSNQVLQDLIIKNNLQLDPNSLQGYVKSATQEELDELKNNKVITEKFAEKLLNEINTLDLDNKVDQTKLQVYAKSVTLLKNADTNIIAQKLFDEIDALELDVPTTKIVKNHIANTLRYLDTINLNNEDDENMRKQYITWILNKEIKPLGLSDNIIEKLLFINLKTLQVITNKMYLNHTHHALKIAQEAPEKAHQLLAHAEKIKQRSDKYYNDPNFNTLSDNKREEFFDDINKHEKEAQRKFNTPRHVGLNVLKNLTFIILTAFTGLLAIGVKAVWYAGSSFLNSDPLKRKSWALLFGQTASSKNAEANAKTAKALKSTSQNILLNNKSRS